MRRQGHSHQNLAGTLVGNAHGAGTGGRHFHHSAVEGGDVLGRGHGDIVDAGLQVVVVGIREAGEHGPVRDVEFIVVVMVHRAPGQPPLGGMQAGGEIAALALHVNFRQHFLGVPVLRVRRS